MEIVTCALLTSPHGFPTRLGGVSTGSFASLNCAAFVGDAPKAVEENLMRLVHAVGVKHDTLLTVSQVHGSRVLQGRAASGGSSIGEGDALWTDVYSTSVGVFTADCLPILLEDPIAKRVAAVHAGWRGILADVVTCALHALEASGSNLTDVRVAIGPCIQRCCCEVNGDLPDRFQVAFGNGVLHRMPGTSRTHLDLPKAVELTLARAGLPDTHVARLPYCTVCDSRFYSHRRDGKTTGRHLSLICCSFAH